MKWSRWAQGGAIAAVCSLALTPAISAVRSVFKGSEGAQVSLKVLGSIGSFTPVMTDEPLAKAYARAAVESQSRGFRFTPTSGATSGNRSLTVVVRAPATGPSNAVLPDRASSSLGIAPMSYSLGPAKGLLRHSVGAALSARDLDPVVEPGDAPKADFALAPKPKRFSTNLELESRALVAGSAAASGPPTLNSEKTYAVDLSSSYSLTKNLNVQAGVRYRGPNNRLVPLDDQAKDSQAVYVGTTFKF